MIPGKWLERAEKAVDRREKPLKNLLPSFPYCFCDDWERKRVLLHTFDWGACTLGGVTHCKSQTVYKCSYVWLHVWL